MKKLLLKVSLFIRRPAGRALLIILISLVVGLLTSQLFRSVALGSGETGNSYRQGIIERGTKPSSSGDTVHVRILSGSYSQQVLEARVGSVINSLDLTQPAYRAGEHVLVSVSAAQAARPEAIIIDHYRLPGAAWILIAVLVMAVIFAGIRGIGALGGLIISIFIVSSFIIPQIISGHSPYITTALGIIVISLLGIYTAHGLSRRTSLALVATYLTLTVAAGLSAIAVNALHLSGVASENTFFLTNLLPDLDMRGLLLCGTVISIIGILDDVTVGQATAVQELQAANTALSRRELYRRGLRIGREHIASLINTLVLAFVGTSFLFVFYIAATSQYPLLVNLNTEFVMEEVVRSLVGSAALILAVPISTLLAARYLTLPDPAAPSGMSAVIRRLLQRRG